MPYVNDDDIIICDPGDLYHGDVLHEGVDDSVELESFNQGTSVMTTVADGLPSVPTGLFTNPPGWQYVNRICGD